MQYAISGGRRDGFLRQLWFGVRNFAGGGAIAIGFGAVIAAICLAIGLVLRALLEAARWAVALL